MKLAVLTCGTEGDARPLAALRHAGHDAIVLGDARTLGLASTLGVRAMALAGDVRTLFAGGASQSPRRTAAA